MVKNVYSIILKFVLERCLNSNVKKTKLNTIEKGLLP